jgi:hypothetical protein
LMDAPQARGAAAFCSAGQSAAPSVSMQGTNNDAARQRPPDGRPQASPPPPPRRRPLCRARQWRGWRGGDASGRVPTARAHVCTLAVFVSARAGRPAASVPRRVPPLASRRLARVRAQGAHPAPAPATSASPTTRAAGWQMQTPPLRTVPSRGTAAIRPSRSACACACACGADAGSGATRAWSGGRAQNGLSCSSESTLSLLDARQHI